MQIVSRSSGSKIMVYQLLLVLIGLVGFLRLVFPRPAKKPKSDPKFYTKPPKVILPVVVANQIDRFTDDFFGLRLLKANTDQVIDLVKKVPYSDIFGPQDEIIVSIKKFNKGFEASNPSAFGFFANNRYRRINLEKRTQVMEYVIKNPHIANIPITKPIIITGMMRTGSTLLYNLLHQDPNCRSPYLWEMAGTNPNPTPPPTSDEDSRIKDVDKAVQIYGFFIPEILSESAKSHFTAAHEIEECLFVMIHQHIHQVILPLSGPEYLEWFLDDKNKEYVYIYLKRYLQMLTSGYAPKSHWTLKAPIHSVYFSHLCKTFPDATIVITHRNPEEVVPSTCKLMEMGSFFHYNENTLDKRWIGECSMRMSETMCHRIMSYREQHPEEQQRFVDVNYNDLLDDPIGVVKSIYQKAGHQYTPIFENRMKAYMEANPQGKHGRNKYSLDLYGLSEEEMNQRFKKYRETYAV